MQKEPAKAGSFFDGRGKMMGSRFRVVVAASPLYKSGDARRSAMAGFPRIVSPPGKVPRRGGEGSGGMKESGEMRLKGEK